MGKCIDSITMNRYNLNVPINSIMLLGTYESTQSLIKSIKNDSNDSIKSVNQLNIYVDIFGKTFYSVDLFCKTLISLTFLWIFWINSNDSIIPIPQSQSIHSPTLWKRIDSVTNQLTSKGNWINSINFAEKGIDSNQSTQSSLMVYKSDRGG